MEVNVWISTTPPAHIAAGVHDPYGAWISAATPTRSTASGRAARSPDGCSTPFASTISGLECEAPAQPLDRSGPPLLPGAGRKVRVDDLRRGGPRSTPSPGGSSC